MKKKKKKRERKRKNLLRYVGKMLCKVRLYCLSLSLQLDLCQ